MHYRTGSLLSQDLKGLGDSWRRTTPARQNGRYALVCGVLCLIATIGWLGTSTIASVDPNPKSDIHTNILEQISVDQPAKSEAIAKPQNTSVDVHPDVSPRSIDVDSQLSWTTTEVRRGDTLTSIFQRFGLGVGAAIEIAELSGADQLSRLRPGRTLRISKDPTSGGIKALRYKLGLTQTLAIDRRGQEYEVSTETRELEIRHKRATGTIRTSLFQAANDAGVSDQLVMQLVSIFGWDIDFARDLRQGDRFSAIYEEQYLDSKKVGIGSIVATEFANRDRTYRAIQHIDQDGYASYYTPDGLSLRRTFLRTPLQFSRITSSFAKRRYHPVLKTWRAHKGVDYGAPSGTPVYTTADGRIVHLGNKGGYGRTVIIRHGGKYTTLYAHMKAYKKGLRQGQSVKQGQTIGYVGQTGLATGPHLHYEFRVNEIHQDPLKFKQPQAEPIRTAYKKAFLQQATTWNRELDLLQTRKVADSGTAKTP